MLPLVTWVPVRLNFLGGGSLTFANHHEPSISEAEDACPDENITQALKGLT